MPNRPAQAATRLKNSTPLTGLDVARATGARVVIGESGDDPCYAWRHGVIVLPPEVARGTDVGSLVIAAEEAAHHEQPRWVHGWRWVQPMRWFAEADVFLRVKRILGVPGAKWREPSGAVAPVVIWLLALGSYGFQ